MSSAPPLTIIKTHGHRKRKFADVLLSLHRSCTFHKLPESLHPSAVRVVCVSDTHNRFPDLPSGDVLIHAGDLTENGSFEEMQAGLSWLSSQPHKHKIFVAGNHDVLLDELFLLKHPERRYGQSKTKEDLDWGSVIYLQDSAITLEVLADQGKDTARRRALTIFGSPWTPQYGISAFQYHPNDTQRWETIFGSLERKPDIVITHGPPHLHLDKRDFHRAGCPFLAEEIHRTRPRLSVFGHIHASYGREDIELDRVQKAYEEVMKGCGGWICIVWMAILVVMTRLKMFFTGPGEQNLTTFVNASAVGGSQNELKNSPIIVDL